MNFDKEINLQKEYILYLKQHKQYFEKDFIKNKTLRNIIYEITKKMFLNFGKSMLICMFISDILSFVEENRTITKINNNEIKKACNSIKNIRLLNLKIANEIQSLIKNF